MNLLYCLNALVVAIHTDTQPFVDPALYGAGVRIIPWGDVSTLTRSGPPAPPGQSPPPYQQPTETPAILKSYASQVRYLYAIAGINFTAASGVVPVQTDRTSQMLIANLAAYAATLTASTPVDFTQNSIHYALLASECGPMSTAVNRFVQQFRTTESACLADLNSPTPTIKTYADVDTKFGTPTLISISPTTYVHGTATTITATGTAFASTSQILIDGTVATTTFVSATQLTATAPASLAAGTHNVTVKNASGFSSAAQVLTLT
jgi:hypothetical protein